MESKAEQAKQLEEIKKNYNAKVDENIRKNKLASSNLLRKLGMTSTTMELPSSSFWESLQMTVSSLFVYFLDNIPDLAIKLIIVSIIVCIYYVIGSTLLYVTKATQTGVLPVSMSCFPYTEKTPQVVEVVTNLFSMYIENTEKSIHLQFPYDKNSSNPVIDFYRKYKLSQSSEKSIIYLLSIVASLHSFYYSMIQFTGRKLSYFSDITITLLSPVIYFMTALFMYFVGNVYFVFLWFYQMKWFFKENKNCGKTGGKVNWEYMNMFFSPFSFYLAILMTMFACFLSFFVIISLFMSPIISVPSLSILYCFMSVMSFKGLIQNKFVNVLDIVMKTFVYFRPAIFLSICVFTVYRSEVIKYMINYYQEYNKKSQQSTNQYLQKNNSNDTKLQKQNNQYYNINNKVTNTLEDAYRVSIPYSIIMLSIICFLLQRFQLLQPTDFDLFENVIPTNDNDDTINPSNCEDTGGVETDQHTFIFKGYVILKSLLTAYQNMFSLDNNDKNNNDHKKTTEIQSNRSVNISTPDKIEKKNESTTTTTNK